MSDSCPAAHHKSCFTAPSSGFPLLYPLFCVVIWPCKAHSSSPLSPHQTLGTPHAMACFGNMGKAVTANSQCQGSHCSWIATPGNSSFPTIWFAQFTPTRHRDEGSRELPKVTTGTLSVPALPFTPILADRVNEEDFKFYFPWVLVMQCLF